MKCWTKKEFMERIMPCSYRVRIWWFFVWHKHVTLLDIMDARDVPDDTKQMLAWQLDIRLWQRAMDISEFVGMRGLVANIRAELLNEKA